MHKQFDSLPSTQGPELRQRGMGAPPSATENLDSSCSGDGRKVRSDET